MITARAPTISRSSGLVIDGAGKPLPDVRRAGPRGQAKSFRMVDCEMRRSSRNGVALDAVEGAVTGTIVTGAARPRSFRATRRA